MTLISYGGCYIETTDNIYWSSYGDLPISPTAALDSSTVAANGRAVCQLPQQPFMCALIQQFVEDRELTEYKIIVADESHMSVTVPSKAESEKSTASLILQTFVDDEVLVEHKAVEALFPFKVAHRELAHALPVVELVNLKVCESVISSPIVESIDFSFDFDQSEVEMTPNPSGLRYILEDNQNEACKFDEDVQVIDRKASGGNPEARNAEVYCAVSYEENVDTEFDKQEAELNRTAEELRVFSGENLLKIDVDYIKNNSTQKDIRDMMIALKYTARNQLDAMQSVLQDATPSFQLRALRGMVIYQGGGGFRGF